MKSLKSKYGLCQVDNNKFSTIQITGTGITDDNEPGYIWAPYIPMMVDDETWIRYKRSLEIQKRKEKIESIIKKINNK